MTDCQKKKLLLEECLAQCLNLANEKTKTQAIKLLIATTLPLYREQCSPPTSGSKGGQLYILNKVSGFKKIYFAFYTKFKWEKYSTSKVI